jgi:integrase
VDTTTGIETTRNIIAMQAAALNLSPEALLKALQEDVTPLTGITLAEYFPRWAATLDLTHATARTYRNAVDPVANGMRLEHRTVPPGRDEIIVVPVKDLDAERWLQEARSISRELSLDLDVPTLADSRRTEDGSVLLWPGLGHLPPGAITTTDLTLAARWVRLRALTNGRTKRNPVCTDGMGAVRGMLSAVGHLYTRAAGDKVVPAGTDPTVSIKRGRRRRKKDGSTHTVEHRRTLTGEELVEISDIWCGTGDDRLLDSWLFEYHLRTGSRRAGALGLTLDLIDVEKQLIYPPDKDSEASRGVRHDDGAMPVPRALAEGLIAFARSRGAVRPDERVFRGLKGRPISARRYDTIKKRCSKLPYVAAMDRFGPHHLRSTGAAWTGPLRLDT